jgi:hypothetical protein
MNLNALFTLMKQKGFYYFSGLTNTRENNLYLRFSTLYDEKGDVVEFRIGDNNNDLQYWINDNGYTHTELLNVNENEIFLFIKSDFKRK